jgi:hypothetical protein
MPITSYIKWKQVNKQTYIYISKSCIQKDFWYDESQKKQCIVVTTGVVSTSLPLFL